MARRLRPRTIVRLARFLAGYARGVEHERPIFIVGVPRSGTSSLVQLLAGSSGLRSPPHESHNVWLTYHHPRWSRWDDAAVGPGQVRLGERRFVNSYFYTYCGCHRFVDKTPANSLRIPHVLEVFPDAVIIAVRRDPCDVVNALIKGWRLPDGRFRSFYVPEDLHIPDHPHRRQWRFALVPGWRDCVGRPVHEVAFTQWERISGAIEAARTAVPSRRWVDVYLEDLRDQPDETLSFLCERLEIANEERLAHELKRLNENPAHASSPPIASKWRHEHAREVRELLPRIAAAAPERGYLVNPTSGESEILRLGRERIPPATDRPLPS